MKAPFDALSLMDRLGLEWRPASSPLRLRRAGERIPRAKFAHGPRLTGGTQAWEDLGRR